MDGLTKKSALTKLPVLAWKAHTRMKKCSYCGKEYSDEVATCPIDGELLPTNSPSMAVTDEQPICAMQRQDHPDLVFPDYHWSVWDAWKCAGSIVVLIGAFWIAVSLLGWHFSAFHAWRLSGSGVFSLNVLSYSIELLIAVYLARTDTFATFWKGFGLDRKPSNYVWFGITMALIIRLAGHFVLTQGWSKGVSNYETYGFKHTIGFERYFFLVPLLVLAPVFEELVYRGFLYKAFRTSYPMIVSMALIVAWTANTHWSYYSHSWIAALDLSMLTIVQCYLREKSDSLWDCILCHFTFNFSLLFSSTLLR